jgi:outer membrane immunogenic protein
MHKLSKIAGSVIAAAAMLGGAGAALADGYAAKGKAVYERPANWSGFYFGVGSGYQWSNVEVVSAGYANSLDHDQSSPFVNAFMGVQHQVGAIVLGVEGGWKSTFRDDWSSERCPFPGTISCRARLNDMLTIGGRIGFAAGHWMPYLTGGYATARFEHEERVEATDVLNFSGGTRHNGWYFGGGFEWQVSPGWTAGLEYRHYELGDAETDLTNPAGTVFVASRSDDASIDTITARVAWRWGRPEPAPLK